MLKSFTLSTVALTGLAFAVTAQNQVTQDGNTTVINFTTGMHMITSSGTGSTAADKVIDKQTTPILSLGNPDLGKYAFTMVLPAYGEPSITVEEGTYTDHANVNILPSKGSLKRNVNPADVAFTYGESYSTDAFYPANRAIINEPFNLRTVRGASIHVFPYAYNPVTKVLRVYHNLKITVTTDMSKPGINPLFQNAFESEMEPVYDHLFLNY
ncbi:MAG TPA: C25 family peptidase propeptide domain-containing protein, partial [Flavobacteriales bacterium]|nr:C25 family peptidase propeptide domain-containing protein [Flavobacteriales bacterium]